MNKYYEHENPTAVAYMDEVEKSWQVASHKTERNSETTLMLLQNRYLVRFPFVITTPTKEEIDDAKEKLDADRIAKGIPLKKTKKNHMDKDDAVKHTYENVPQGCDTKNDKPKTSDLPPLSVIEMMDMVGSYLNEHLTIYKGGYAVYRVSSDNTMDIKDNDASCEDEANENKTSEERKTTYHLSRLFLSDEINKNYRDTICLASPDLEPQKDVLVETDDRTWEWIVAQIMETRIERNANNDTASRPGKNVRLANDDTTWSVYEKENTTRRRIFSSDSSEFDVACDDRDEEAEDDINTCSDTNTPNSQGDDEKSKHAYHLETLYRKTISPEEQLIEKEGHDELMEQVKENCSRKGVEVVILREEHLTFKEIGNVLHITEQAANSRMKTVRKMMGGVLSTHHCVKRKSSNRRKARKSP